MVNDCAREYHGSNAGKRRAICSGGMVERSGGDSGEELGCKKAESSDFPGGELQVRGAGVSSLRPRRQNIPPRTYVSRLFYLLSGLGILRRLILLSWGNV